MNAKALPKAEYEKSFEDITEKVCLCEGLCSSVYIKNNMVKPRENRAVTICPGPNTAYFSGIYSLDEMVKHIYGRLNLLEGTNRPNMFVNEIKLYIEYLRKDAETNIREITVKKAKQLEKFKEQLIIGINYYKDLLPDLMSMSKALDSSVQDELERLRMLVDQIRVPGVMINNAEQQIR